MNPGLLLRHYERVADAPDATARLRRFILDLAVRGKLVSQDPDDEPASDLLKEIAAEKARLVKSGEIRKAKAHSDVGLDEMPFQVPAGWKWVRIRHVTSDRGQVIPHEEFTYIDVTAINKDAGRIESPRVTAANEAPSRARKVVRTGDVLYSCVRPYLLNIAVVDKDISPSPIASTAFAVLTGFGLVHPKYQWLVLRSPFMVACVESKMRGQAYPAINDSDFARLPFPLPPLAEQRRIVAKVDELMALCDQLEAVRKEQEATRDRMAVASLARLSSPDAKRDVFASHARFALDNLSALTARPDQILHFRQAILNLAVRGRLVAQDRNEQAAESFVISNETERKDRIQAPLPSGWSWARVQDVAEARLGKMLDKAKNSGRLRPYLGNTNVHWFDIRKDQLKELRIDDNEAEKYTLRAGDVLICEGGHGIGRTAVWRDGGGNVLFQKALHRVRPGPALHSDFFSYCAFVYFHLGVLEHYFTGVGIPHFTGKALAELVFPLAPLAEQRRIVAKVDELMALCDRLEASLVSGEDHRRRLLGALLAEALAPSEMATA